MKKKHIWLLADLGMLSVALFAAFITYRLLSNTVSTVINVIIGVVVFSLINRAISNWFYAGVSMEERFRGGDDE